MIRIHYFIIVYNVLVFIHRMGTNIIIDMMEADEPARENGYYATMRFIYSNVWALLKNVVYFIWLMFDYFIDFVE